MLTVRELMLPGEPLSGGRLLAGEEGLRRSVAWAVSLRPYPPAFPRLRGEEIALVSIEHLRKLDPPTGLPDVLRELVARGASALAVKGEIDETSVLLAREAGLPLIALGEDALLHEIEEEIIRLCALESALGAVRPEGPAQWLERLLAGESMTGLEPSVREFSIAPMADYAIAYCTIDQEAHSNVGNMGARQLMADAAGSLRLVQMVKGRDTIILVPHSTEEQLQVEVSARGVRGVGLGSYGQLARMPWSFAEAKLASTASRKLRGSVLTRYTELGVDLPLLVLHRDNPEELRRFVRQVLGPLLKSTRGPGQSLLTTLKVYAEHGGRLRETALHLFIHRNTLAYRLDRISDLLGRNLRDTAQLLALQLAVRALPLVEGSALGNQVSEERD